MKKVSIFKPRFARSQFDRTFTPRSSEIAFAIFRSLRPVEFKGLSGAWKREARIGNGTSILPAGTTFSAEAAGLLSGREKRMKIFSSEGRIADCSIRRGTRGKILGTKLQLLINVAGASHLGIHHVHSIPNEPLQKYSGIKKVEQNIHSRQPFYQ